MPCYLTQTAIYLPGPPVTNDAMHRYIGTLDGEDAVREQVLAMNGITARHYAQGTDQTPTHDVYDLASRALGGCLAAAPGSAAPGMLAVGTTYAPLSGPGIGTVVHERLRQSGHLNVPVEISSHAGICTSSAAALIHAARAVDRGDHASALCAGAEHPSQILKSSVIRPEDDRADHADLRKSRWFMSVFLRSMLSDGAGAFLLENRPAADRLSLRVDWTHARSYAHEAPRCMELVNDGARLSQDIGVLSRHLFRIGERFARGALEAHNESLDQYRCVLPHLSSFFFRRKAERMLAALSENPHQRVAYWTNLASAGNTGSASIYIMLHDYLKNHDLHEGDRLMLFIPESGQFNFAAVSLTAVRP